MKEEVQGLSFLSVLTALFVGLKLTENIDWSWWWVLAPLWVPWTAFSALVFFLLIALITRGIFK